MWYTVKFERYCIYIVNGRPVYLYCEMGDLCIYTVKWETCVFIL